MIDPARIQDDIALYFAAEKRGGMILVAVGVVAIGFAIYLLRGSHRLRSMAYPLIAIAVIQLGVGITMARRPDAQVEAIVAQVVDSPDQFEADEGARMATVDSGFKVRLAIELALIAIGVGIARWKRKNELWYAIALGVVVQASVLSVFDLVAERRAAGYISIIDALHQSGEDMQSQ